jgi:hypothetical protein
MSNWTTLAALAAAYGVHFGAVTCETALEGYEGNICRRTCRLAKWVSVIALALIAALHGFELNLT